MAIGLGLVPGGLAVGLVDDGSGPAVGRDSGSEDPVRGGISAAVSLDRLPSVAKGGPAVDGAEATSTTMPPTERVEKE